MRWRGERGGAFITQSSRNISVIDVVIINDLFIFSCALTEFTPSSSDSRGNHDSAGDWSLEVAFSERVSIVCGRRKNSRTSSTHNYYGRGKTVLSCCPWPRYQRGFVAFSAPIRL